MMQLRLVLALLVFVCGCSPPAAPPPVAEAPPATLPTRRPTASIAPPSPVPGGVDYGAIPERVATTPFPTVAMPVQAAPNFALSFGYGSCRITRILNTFDGRLTQFNLDGSSASISLTLTPAELEQIYDQMVAIAFFSYPERYSTILPDSMLRVISAPHPTYEFRVRNGSLEQVVVFDDAVVRPTTRETDQLRALVTLIRTIVEARPELTQLPPLRESCA